MKVTLKVKEQAVIECSTEQLSELLAYLRDNRWESTYTQTADLLSGKPWELHAERDYLPSADVDIATKKFADAIAGVKAK